MVLQLNFLILLFSVFPMEVCYVLLVRIWLYYVEMPQKPAIQNMELFRYAEKIVMKWRYV